jgi:hypothetical protein
VARTSARSKQSAGAFAAANMPVNSVLPAVTGTKTVGQTLTCSTGTWTQSPSYTYQWRRNGSPIIGATASTRVLTGDDTGATMSCTVKATKNGVSAVATSAETTAVAAA